MRHSYLHAFQVDDCDIRQWENKEWNIDEVDQAVHSGLLLISASEMAQDTENEPAKEHSRDSAHP